MSNTQQPEVLRLAHTLRGGKLIDDSTEWADTLHAAAAELLHQHTRIEELEAQLAATQSAAQAAVQQVDTCETCQGNSEVVTDWNRYKHPHPGDKGDEAVSMCQECNGTGEVNAARDAARYRWLRDNDWRNDEKMEPVIRLHLNAIWDEKIDAALAAQAKHGEAQQ